MELPTYDQFMLPLLKLAAEEGQVHSIAGLREKLALQFGLTSEQLAVRLPSGQQSVFDNRVGWASTHLRKAGLLSRPKRGSVQITPRGMEVLAENLTVIDNHYLQRFAEYREFKERSTNGEPIVSIPNDALTSTTTPEETISKAIGILNAELRDELIDKAKQLTPAQFEGLVLRLLHRAD